MEPYIKGIVEKDEKITCDGCDKELKEGDSYLAVKHTGTFCSHNCMTENA